MSMQFNIKENEENVIKEDSKLVMNPDGAVLGIDPNPPSLIAEDKEEVDDITEELKDDTNNS